MTDASGVTAVLCISKTSWKRIKRAGAVHARDGYITFEPRVPVSNPAQTVVAVLDVEKTLGAGMQVSWSTTGKIISQGDAANSLPLSFFSRIDIPRRTGRHVSSANDQLPTDIYWEPIRITESRRWLAGFISQPTLQRECLVHTPLCEVASESFTPSRYWSGDVPNAGENDCTDDINIIIATPETDCTPAASGDPSARREAMSLRTPLAMNSQRETTPKWLIVPVAIPGCGKTGVCAALTYLFNLSHVQSGDVWKPAGHRSARNPYLHLVAAALNGHDVVVADRNNHLRHHRAALRDICKSYAKLGRSEVRILALNWSIRQPSPQAVYKHCSQRILSWRRGQQWFDLGPKAPLHRVLWRFLDNAELLSAHEADEVVDMDPFESLEDSVWRAVVGVGSVLGLAPPDDERVADAIQAAQAYHPKARMM
ncbi:hypothetical protein AURDEDRAFT_171863 [Auricularia subglabra TFB-10046 SS5]|uniref:tRNA ligase kinase domain-containing protein n=1 Tax=Auricularia subglabra (strain TFB-10046 / SS5) TaxID=717982 RepID=J0WX41_AURST|nr:hypothetical protein AURDEDRAFT_171863 [Auricularia subglabra TFB-10046 SS5]